MADSVYPGDPGPSQRQWRDPEQGLPATENQLPPLLSSEELARWKWANVTNLDSFFCDVYQYYLERGFVCILLRRAVNMAIVLFVVVFTSVLTSCIDYSHLRGAKSLSDVKIPNCMAKSSTLHKLYLWLFGALWLFKAFQYASDVLRLYDLKMFFKHCLGISESEIQTISWQQVVKKLSKLPEDNYAAAGRENASEQQKLDAHNVVNRILRRENYTVALLSRDIVNLKIETPVLGKFELFTKSLEWTMSICIDDFVFGSDGRLRSIFLNEQKRSVLAKGLKRRFQFAAIVHALFAPLIIMYMTLYYFFKYFSEYHKDPSRLGTRRYTPLAEWKLRELNELSHIFDKRLGMSVLPAGRYISQFPHARLDICLKLVIFVCGSFAAVLGMLSIWDPELLAMEITPDGTVLFYLGIFGTALAVSRGMTSTDDVVIDPEESMREVIEYTHYMPEHWEGKLHTEKVKVEFCELYDLKVKIILRELMGIFLNPFMLWHNLAQDSETIIDFYRESSAHVRDLGFICSFAMFDGQAKKVKARADDLDRYYATSDGKMLKSYLNFMDVYGPNATGQYAKRRSAGNPVEVLSGIQLPNTALEESVMEQYSRLQNLAPVSEEIDLMPSDSSTSDPSSSESAEEQVTTGVFGLLNRMSKVGETHR